MNEERERVPLGELLRGLDGKWIAIKDHQVVAAAETPYALVSSLREKGIGGAAIIRAPAVEEPEMVGFG